MSVNELPVVAQTAASTASRQDIVCFWQVSVLKVQPAPGTSPPLFAKQGRNSGWCVWMRSHTGCPIDPVSVIGAFRSLHLGMPPDGSVGVMVEALSLGGCKVPASLVVTPIFLGSLRFAVVALTFSGIA